MAVAAGSRVFIELGVTLAWEMRLGLHCVGFISANTLGQQLEGWGMT